MKSIPCTICGKEITVDDTVVRVTCGECVARGKHVKTYFKVPALNKKVTAPDTPAPVKPERKKASRIDFITERINKGLSNDVIVAEIKAGIPQWKDTDAKRVIYIEKIRAKIAKGGK